VTLRGTLSLEGCELGREVKEENEPGREGRLRRGFR